MSPAGSFGVWIQYPACLLTLEADSGREGINEWERMCGGEVMGWGSQRKSELGRVGTSSILLPPAPHSSPN